MSTITDVQQMNRLLAEQVGQDARNNPDTPYTSKFIGIANGKVVAASDDEDEIDRMLDEIEPDASRVFIVDTSMDPNHVEYVWEHH